MFWGKESQETETQQDKFLQIRNFKRMSGQEDPLEFINSCTAPSWDYTPAGI